MICWINNLEISQSEIIHHQIIILRNHLDSRNMLQQCVMRIFNQISENSSCSRNSQFMFINSKTFQRLCFEMRSQFFVSIRIFECPIFQLENILISKLIRNLRSSLINNLARVKSVNDVKQFF